VKARLTWVVFWVLVGCFVAVACVFLIPAAREAIANVFMAISGAALFFLGAALILLAVKRQPPATPRRFLILSGASAAGIPASVLLHNAIYGLLIHWFGHDFWDRIGLADEPVFFFLAILICPASFLVGAIGTVLLATRRPR
jgi:hypothetical protein